MKLPVFNEDPRVTKPYTEEQWATIIGLGHKVDEYMDGSDYASDDGR